MGYFDRLNKLMETYTTEEEFHALFDRLSTISALSTSINKYKIANFIYGQYSDDYDFKQNINGIETGVTDAAEAMINAVEDINMDCKRRNIEPFAKINAKSSVDQILYFNDEFTDELKDYAEADEKIASLIESGISEDLETIYEKTSGEYQGNMSDADHSYTAEGTVEDVVTNKNVQNAMRKPSAYAQMMKQKNAADYSDQEKDMDLSNMPSDYDPV